jgi:hypothetical protein
MVYFLPWQKQYAGSFFERAAMTSVAAPSTVLTPELSALTPELTALTPELDVLTPDLPGEPVVISDLGQIGADELLNLQALAAPVASRGRASPKLVQQTILALCRGRYLGLRVLAELLGRNPDGVDLRKRILNPLVSGNALQRAYPNPNDPRQAYTTQTTPNSESIA